MELNLYPTLLHGNAPEQLWGVPTPKNMFASIKKLAVKIAELNIGMIYNLLATLFFDAESTKTFVQELYSDIL